MAPLRVGLRAHDPDVAEPVQVVADSGRRELELCGQLGPGAWALGEQPEDAQAGGVGDGLEQRHALVEAGTLGMSLN